MSYRSSHRSWTALAALLLAASTTVPATAEPSCYGDWSDAAPVVARERLKSARDVQGIARNRLGGDIVRITLCQDAGSFVYRLVVRSDDGRISNLTVDAGRDER